jgi:O-antigen/teichoic acid export membrane protein
LLDLTALTIAMFVAGGFGQALFYYYSKAFTPERRAVAVSSAFFGALLLGAMPALLGVAAAPYLSTALFRTAQYAGMLQLTLFTIALSFPAEIGFCCMQVMDRPRLYAGLALLRLCLGLGLNIFFLVGLHCGVLGLLWSNLALTIAAALFSTWFCLPALRFFLDFKLFLALIRFSWPLNLSSIAAVVLNYGDRFVLQRNVSMAEVGIYALAYKVGLVINFTYLTFNIAWKARMFVLVEEPGGSKVYVRMCTYLALLLTFATVAIAVLIRPAAHIGIGAAYQESVRLVPWIAVIYVIKGIGEYFRNAFQLQNKTGLDAQVAWFGTAVCVAGYLLLIPRFKLWGAVAATGISFAYMFVYGYRKAQQVRRFEFELRRLGIICLAAAITLLAYWLISPVNIFWQTLAGVLLTLSFPLLLLCLGFAEEDEKRFFAGIVVDRWPHCAAVLRLRSATLLKR